MNFKLFTIFVVAVFIAIVSKANAAPSNNENQPIGKKTTFLLQLQCRNN